jgi:Zn-dependent peptidase ImmA (M78 family)
MKKLGQKEKKRKKKKKILRVSVPFLESTVIEEESYRRVRFRDERVSLEDVCAKLEAEVGLQIIYATEPSTALGSIDLNALVVTIFTTETSAENQRYALAFLIGHVALSHNRYMDSALCYESHVDIQLKSTTAINGASSLEWQARYFASSLLMPRQVFLGFFTFLQEKLDFRDRGRGPIYLDDQLCNRILYAEILTEFRIFFGAPKALVAFRISALGLLTDARRPLRVTEEVVVEALNAKW